MPTKFQLITELYDQTVQSVTGCEQSWTGLMNNLRHSAEELVLSDLIYA